MELSEIIGYNAEGFAPALVSMEIAYRKRGKVSIRKRRGVKLRISAHNIKHKTSFAMTPLFVKETGGGMKY